MPDCRNKPSLSAIIHPLSSLQTIILLRNHSLSYSLHMTCACLPISYAVMWTNVELHYFLLKQYFLGRISILKNFVNWAKSFRIFQFVECWICLEWVQQFRIFCWSVWFEVSEGYSESCLCSLSNLKVAVKEGLVIRNLFLFLNMLIYESEHQRDESYVSIIKVFLN